MPPGEDDRSPFTEERTEPFLNPFGWGRHRARRTLIAIGSVVGILIAGFVGVHLWANSEGTKARVRGRVRALLEDRLGPVTVGDRVSVGWFGTVEMGPIAIPGSSADRPPVIAIASLFAEPRLGSVLSGKPELTRVTARDIRVEAGAKGAELRALAGRIRDRRKAAEGGKEGGGGARAWPELRFEELNLRVERVRTIGLDLAGSEDAPPPPLDIGPVAGRAVIRRDAGGTEVDGLLHLPGKGRVQGGVKLSADGALSAHAQLWELKTLALPERLRALTPSIKEGSLAGDVNVEIPADRRSGAATVAFEVRDLTVADARLASGPIGPVFVGGGGNLKWNLDTRRFSVEGGRLAVGDKGQARVNFQATVVASTDPTFAFGARVEHVDYQDALDALPAALVPGPETPRLDGLVSAWVQLTGPLKRRSEWELTAELDLSGLREAAKQREPIFLKGPFMYEPEDGEGKTRKMVVGPQNKSFVPIAELPSWVPRAVTTAEDGAFFVHHGFDFSEMMNSFVADAEAGRAVRGGSTISQQLAKNLFLSREKTYARKVREAFITVALEAALTKQRLLEIYLNIIEWGPGIYGIGEAAHHYFGKDARRLTPKEAVFLATIIPNPVKYHVYYQRGALTESWEQKVQDILVKMRDANILTPEQMAEALRTPLAFHRG